MPEIPHGIHPRPERPKRSRPVPPSIGFLRGQGVQGVRAACTTYNCGHHAVVPFDRLGKPETTLFPALKFKCSRCGGREINTMPDWPKPGDGIPATWGGK
jgi:hypothetical protein